MITLSDLYCNMKGYWLLGMLNESIGNRTSSNTCMIEFNDQRNKALSLLTTELNQFKISKFLIIKSMKEKKLIQYRALDEHDDGYLVHSSQECLSYEAL